MPGEGLARQIATICLTLVQLSAIAFRVSSGSLAHLAHMQTDCLASSRVHIDDSCWQRSAVVSARESMHGAPVPRDSTTGLVADGYTVRAI